MLPNTTEYLPPHLVNDYYPGLTPRWLARQRWEHKPPTYIKAGRRVMYRRADIEQFLAENTVVRT